MYVYCSLSSFSLSRVRCVVVCYAVFTYSMLMCYVCMCYSVCVSIPPFPLSTTNGTMLISTPIATFPRSMCCHVRVLPTGVPSFQRAEKFQELLSNDLLQRPQWERGLRLVLRSRWEKLCFMRLCGNFFFFINDLIYLLIYLRMCLFMS